MACTLYGIMARESPRAVILRRGGTERVRLILWDTEADGFEPGQWFKGRIFGDLSDLSPDGSLLIYAAGKRNMGAERAGEFGYAWTAISRPPYLTALALWPAARPGESGGISDGGGLFVDARTVLLDHQSGMTEPHPQHAPPRSLKIVHPDHPHFGLPDPAGNGTLPTELYRLVRDGWRVVQRIEFARSGRWSNLVHPWLLERPAPGGEHALVLRDDHSYYWGGSGRHYYLRDKETWKEALLEGVQWADFDRVGRLVFAPGWGSARLPAWPAGGRGGCPGRLHGAGLRVDRGARVGDAVVGFRGGGGPKLYKLRIGGWCQGSGYGPIARFPSSPVHHMTGAQDDRPPQQPTGQKEVDHAYVGLTLAGSRRSARAFGPFSPTGQRT